MKPLARCVTDHPNFCFLLKFDFLELTSNWFVVVALQYIAVPGTLRPCMSSCAVCGYTLVQQNALSSVRKSYILIEEWLKGPKCVVLCIVFIYVLCAALRVNTARLVSSELDVVCVEGLRKIKKPFSQGSRLPSLNPERRGSTAPLLWPLHCLQVQVLPAVLLTILAFCDVSPCRLLNSYRRFGGTSCLYRRGQEEYCIVYMRWRHFAPPERRWLFTSRESNEYINDHMHILIKTVNA